MNRLLLPAPATKQEPPTEDTAPDLDNLHLDYRAIEITLDRL